VSQISHYFGGKKMSMQPTDLRTARKRAGLTQERLAELVGTDRANIAGLESAARAMSAKMGERLSEHVDVASAELVIANRLAAIKRSKEQGDAAGVLTAAKGIVQIVGDRELTPEGETFIDNIVDGAIEFATKNERYEDEQEYGVDVEGEDRDLMGRKVVTKSVAANDFDPSFYNLHSGHRNQPLRDELEDDQEYGDIDDGRDAYGVRVRPLRDDDLGDW
jgi:transcriptional regulator with XRE-family HTH domain